MKEKLKPITPYLCAILALLIALGCVIFALKYFNTQSLKVEQYCAKVNETNVQEYKGCIQLKPVEILDNLANGITQMYDVPNLPEIKGLK